MRKIKSQAEIDRKNKRNQLILGVFLIFILVAALGGFAFMSRDGTGRSSEVVDKGYEFYNNGAYWAMDVGDQSFYFENLPSAVENVSVNGSLDIGSYVDRPLYIVNPTSETGAILSNVQRYVLRYQEACLVENCSEGDLPVKNCSVDNVLIFEPEKDEEIEVVEGCVYIRGSGSRLSDAFVYEALNIN